MRGLGGLPLTSLPEDDEEGCNDTCKEKEKEEDLLEEDLKSNQSPEEEEEEAGNDESITGVLVGRSVRSHYASLNLVVVEEDDMDHYHVMVMIIFHQDCVSQLRSYMRRYCKNGDLLHIQQGAYCLDQDPLLFVVDVTSVQQAQEILQVRQVRYWGMSKWQEWQAKLYRQAQKQQHKQQNQSKTSKTPSGEMINGDTKTKVTTDCCHHSGGLEKRQQGEFVANFLINMILAKLEGEASLQDSHSSTWATKHSSSKAAVDYLNQGSGVLDVAGGSGHVSMALGMLGIQSTVVDPREAAGKLPGRDRKIWNRSLKGKTTTIQPTPPAQPVTTTTNCQPAVVQLRPFETARAWFGNPPQGVDVDFRTPDHHAPHTDIAIYNADHPTVQTCRAIIGLHPDEATDAIVDVAVQLRIPFVVVPCCVFCRLFPHRRQRDNTPVSTYQELLDYLQATDPSIQRATLPFIGANTVLYSTF